MREATEVDILTPCPVTKGGSRWIRCIRTGGRGVSRFPGDPFAVSWDSMISWLRYRWFVYLEVREARRDLEYLEGWVEDWADYYHTQEG